MPNLATQGRRGLRQPLPERYGQLSGDVDIKYGFPGSIDSMNQDVHVMDGALGKRIRRECHGVQINGQAAVQQQARFRARNPQDSSTMANSGNDCVATKRCNVQLLQYFIFTRPRNPQALRPDPEDRSIAGRSRPSNTGRDPAIQTLRQPVADRIKTASPAGDLDEISLQAFPDRYGRQAYRGTDLTGLVNGPER